MRKLINDIRDAPELQWDFDKQAREMGVTLIHFRRLFKRKTGFPPVRFLNHARLSRAAALLRDTDEPIKWIAEKVGVDDVFYFSKLFKCHFKIPPSRYRGNFKL
jgi:transcriptional regulator GlxA family with amidase domain